MHCRITKADLIDRRYHTLRRLRNIDGRPNALIKQPLHRLVTSVQMNLLQQFRKLTSVGHETQHDPNQPILELRHIDAGYNGHTILEDISFTLRHSKRIAVVGPNGAGKSTLFKSIAGILQPTTGTIRIGGRQPGHHICIAYHPQRSEIDWDFPVTVYDVVMMGRVGRIGLFSRPGKKDHRYVRECIDTVGLTPLSRQKIKALSGGEQQRMFIARALAQEAELMLLDEPFSGLDLPSRGAILGLLDQLARRSVTVLVSLHDLNMAAGHFDQILLLNRKLIGCGTAKEVMTPALLRQAYGSHMHVVDTDSGQLIIEDTCCDHGE